MSDFVEARFEKLRNESDGDWNDVCCSAFTGVAGADV